MARILVLSSHPLFSTGGHLTIARCLVDALQADGHEAEFLPTPQNRFGRQGAAYLATRLIDVGVGHDGRRIDQVISLRYPSYAVRHPRHVCWLNHTMREYYDLWERFSADLSWRNRLKERLRRRVLHRTDRWLLGRNVTRLFVQSRTVQQRLRAWLDLEAEVLHPPPPPRPYRCDGYDGDIFVVSRLTAVKRIDLVLRALATPDAAGVRCRIAGDGDARDGLLRLVAELGLAGRVVLLGRIDDGQLVDELARCRAVCFAPYQEDYGFVTVEAFAAAKAVVTCTDSGGPAELVDEGINGFVADPSPEAVGAALGRLAGDASLAERLGGAAQQRATRSGWPDVVRRLLEA